MWFLFAKREKKKKKRGAFSNQLLRIHKTKVKVQTNFKYRLQSLFPNLQKLAHFFFFFFN